MASALRTAVIGVGYLGRFHAQKYAALKDCELVAVADPDAERLAQIGDELSVAGVTDYRQLLDQVEAVSIVAPTHEHYAIAHACLSAGCHILVEKPFTSSIEQASTLIELADQKNLVLQVGLLERFNAAFCALMQGLDAPRFLEVHRLAPWNDRGAEIDVTLDLMIHDLDLTLTVVGEDPSDIRASGAAVIGDTLDLANVRLEFPGGCVANVTASRLSRRQERRMRVFQAQSCAALDLLERRLDLYQLSDGTDRPQERLVHTSETFEETDSLEDEIRHFVDCIHTHSTPLVSGEAGLRALRVALEVSQLMHGKPKS